jgi:hypothetical protein
LNLANLVFIFVANGNSRKLVDKDFAFLPNRLKKMVKTVPYGGRNPNLRRAWR